MKCKVLHCSSHYYVWVFLKQKIKPAPVSKEIMKISLMAAAAGCTVLLFALRSNIPFYFKQLS